MGVVFRMLVLRSQSLKRGPHFTVTKCGDSNRHDFADEKIDKRRRNIKMEITALYSPAPVGQNFTQQLSVQECQIQRKIGAIYTEWQGQLAGIGPGGFEV